TKIKFDIPANLKGIEGSPVSLRVFNALGNEVAILVHEQKSPGTYEVEWNADGWPSGVYFYQLNYGSLVETKKMLLVK
ncbi:MAG: T9SS type A sorting domain-containing protein, partial [Ignavibacteriaceae bacterium]|nr:T9SS type A sorting domain-containing protein [Ignavibacteriaceae bacterium]